MTDSQKEFLTALNKILNPKGYMLHYGFWLKSDHLPYFVTDGNAKIVLKSNFEDLEEKLKKLVKLHENNSCTA